MKSGEGQKDGFLAILSPFFPFSSKSTSSDHCCSTASTTSSLSCSNTVYGSIYVASCRLGSQTGENSEQQRPIEVLTAYWTTMRYIYRQTASSRSFVAVDCFSGIVCTISREFITTARGERSLLRARQRLEDQGTFSQHPTLDSYLDQFLMQYWLIIISKTSSSKHIKTSARKTKAASEMVPNTSPGSDVD